MTCNIYKGMIESMDTNKDGKVSREELLAAIESYKTLGPAHAPRMF